MSDREPQNVASADNAGPSRTESAPAAQSDAAATEAQAPPATADTPVSDPAELALQIEAALLTTDRPLSSGKLGEALGHATPKQIQAAVAGLNELYEKTGRSFRVEALAGGWQILTLPRFAAALAALHKTRAQTRLTPAALETLAIVAYKQPILRADLEAIRGVACGEVLRSLMDRRLVKIVGRAEVLGRPMLYGTTKVFLEIFGLASLKDLPKAEELRPKV
jgi:segregation and condensation protein B